MTNSNAIASTVVVTGSRSGIGAAIARRLAHDGWAVIGVDLGTDESATFLAEQRVADLSNSQQVAALVASLPRVRALVHAAGFMRTGSLTDLDPSDGDAMWAVHVRALVLLAQALCPGMVAGGRLLAIGSRTSTGAAGRSQYAACKAAVVALIRSWAIELASKGITANVIAPAATATPMLASRSRANVPPIMPPIGRFIDPEEIAAYAAFLLSPQAAAITGQELLVCGGASL
jgi:3-oxoacyl-[acyl-carrier protein] reductase